MLSNALERPNNTKAVTCLRSIASRARSVLKILILTISAVMSKKRHMFSPFVYRVLVMIVAAGPALTGLTIKPIFPLTRHRFDVDRLNSSNENDAVKGVTIMRLF